MNVVVLTIFNAVLMAIGQMLWKHGMTGAEIHGVVDILRAMLNPFVLLGFTIYAGTTLLWLYILNKAEISYVYPIQSLVFVFVLIASIFIFHESVGINRFVGVGLIIVGVIISSLK